MPGDQDNNQLRPADALGGHDWRSSLTIGELAMFIWGRRWRIVVPTVIVTLAAVAYSLLAAQWYRAEALFIVRENKTGGGLTGQLSQFGGLAELAGVNLNQSVRQEPLGVLRSRGFARRFIEQNDLAQTIAKQFGLQQSQHSASQLDIRLVVDQFRRKCLSIVEDKKSGLVAVTIDWTDGESAARWANELGRQLNEEMRARTLVEANQNVAYLSKTLENTRSLALQQAISRLLESELQSIMLAQGARDYALKVVDNAEPPARRARPKRTMIVLAAFLLGLVASTAIALLFEGAFKSSSRFARRDNAA
jgi:uncharacterized protein involved in exopolysaccharide biosynthesis